MDLVTLVNLFVSCKSFSSIFFFSILLPLSKFYLYDWKSQAVIVPVGKALLPASESKYARGGGEELECSLVSEIREATKI